ELSWTLVALAIAQGYMQIIGEHAILLLEAAGRMKVSAVGMLCTQASVVGSIAIVLALSLGKSPVLIASIWLTGMTLVAAVLASTSLALVTPLLFVVIPVIFGADYGSAARPMVILMPAAVLFFGTNVLAPIILLHERTRSVAVVNIVAAAINVIGDIVFIGPL